MAAGEAACRREVRRMVAARSKGPVHRTGLVGKVDWRVDYTATRMASRRMGAAVRMVAEHQDYCT